MARIGRLLSLALIALGVLCPALKAAPAQEGYDSRYGAVVDVSVDDLVNMPESYVGKAVRTKGRLDMLPSTQGLRFSLRGTFGGRVLITPMREAEYEWDTQARSWVGEEIEVTGLVGQGTNPDTGTTAVYLLIWAFLGPPDEKAAARGPVTQTTLEDLVTKPGKLDGKTVSVRGQFRGQNLLGDLPAASRRKSADWVIKEELFAVWVTGKKPKGPGWEFDAGLKRDTGKWLQVTGRVATARGIVTIEATQVALSKAPSPTADALPPPPPPPRPKKPPVVVFSLPLDGEREVPPNTVFKVQFSKDMDEASFKGRVLLRYAGRPRPGDRELDAAKMDYDGGLRTLEIDPGDLLRPGRVVEILLLAGIVDIEGLPLQTRPGLNPGSAVDVLRFQTATSGLLGGSLQ